jgi:hypothetical protein
MSSSAPRALVLDANLLVLLVVGSLGQSLLARHKRTQEYEWQDFLLLEAILADVERVVVTPNILTECSNLLRHVDDKTAVRLATALADFIDHSDEEHCPSAQASKAAEYPRLGLTDAGVLETLDSGLPLLTVDLGLYLAACARGATATNFNHLRQHQLLR